VVNFSKETNRRNTGSYKWDVQENELPMWVADMDFEVPPEVTEALHSRVDHAIFGYNMVPDAYAEAYQGWWSRRHGLTIEKDWLLFVTGVVPALSSIVRKMTTVGENVLILSPVYNIFYNSILNNGRHVLSSDLVYEGGAYQIDFADLEKKCADPQTSLLIFCNPHNPVGKIWDRETLTRVADLCKKHHVLLVSDEIHCDLVQPGKHYTPMLSVDQTNTIMLAAATKAFNMAGMQGAAIIVPDPVLRHRVNRGINTDEVAEPNSFVIAATIAAFNRCEYWINELCAYVEENKRRVCTFISAELPQLHVVPSEATYLLWIDCSAITTDSVELTEFLRRETGLYLSEGAEYGENGRRFVRMNLACPASLVEDGLARLKKGVEAYVACGLDGVVKLG